MRIIKKGSQLFQTSFSNGLILGLCFICLLVVSGSIQAETKTSESIYKDFCKACHEGGFKGWITGAPDVDAPLEWDQFRKKGLETMVKNTINGTEHMDPKGGCKECTDEQIKFTVEYINSKLEK